MIKRQYFLCCSLIFGVVTLAIIGVVEKTKFTPSLQSYQTKGKLHNTTTTNTSVSRNHVLFLKTHKTAGSTVQNILRRYAIKNDIFVGIPLNHHIFGYPAMRKFNRKMMIPPPSRREVGMLTNHMKFNYEEVSAVLPSDTFYLTILRDPATQFESAFRYYSNTVKSFSKADFKTWINEPEKYFLGPGKDVFWFFAKNGMTNDLGFDNLNETDDYIKKSIETMDKTFDLVMIAEYFDVSLLLLKDMLHWSMEDILSLKINSRKKLSLEKVNFELEQKIRNWNKADTVLYQHYEKVLQRRVEKYGKDRMERDLKIYEAKKKELQLACVENELFANQDIKRAKFKSYNPKGVVIEQYKLRENAKNNETCIDLILPELTWDKKLWNYFYKIS